MDVRQLKYFLAVADLRSFANASQSLYVTRQAVSRAISQLEDELNVELFMRDSNGAFLTPAGVMFYDRVRSVVGELDVIRDEMRYYGKNYYQRVRIAFAVGTLQLYEAALLDYKKQRKGSEIEYRECLDSECIALLVDHKVDTAVCTTEMDSPLFSTQQLYRSPYGVLVQRSGELAALEKVDLQTLSCPLGGLQGCMPETLQVKLEYSGYDYHRLLSLARQGVCALLLPQCLVPAEWEDMCWIPAEGNHFWTIYQVYLKTLDRNLLFRSILDEFQIRVLESVKKRGE